jgi:hypothetical protein
MCICVEKSIDNTFEQSSDFVDGTTMGNKINHQQKKLSRNKIIYEYGVRRIQEQGIMGVAIPKLSQLYIIRDEHATLIQSSTIAFGNECMRLVNIVLSTSQIFPTIMGTCDDVSRYLQKELIRRHSSKHFHIIIGKSDDFGFAISDCGHFAEIKQEQYRVLIFSTRQRKRIKVDSHDANSQMKLQWESVVIKRIDN